MLLFHEGLMLARASDHGVQLKPQWDELFSGIFPDAEGHVAAQIDGLLYGHVVAVRFRVGYPHTARYLTGCYKIYHEAGRYALEQFAFRDGGPTYSLTELQVKLEREIAAKAARAAEEFQKSVDALTPRLRAAEAEKRG